MRQSISPHSRPETPHPASQPNSGQSLALSGGISRKVLTQTLRRLQSNGLITRHRYAEAPPRVEYTLTPLGRTLQEPIAMLTEWAQTHGEALMDFQESTAANLSQ
ncbi:winged helix-turn-helix transcriptional regulator [Nocardia heshunensis]